MQHIRADKRPTVYELNFRYKTQFEQPALPWPIDDQNPDKRGSLVIHRPERGSLPGSSGGASTVPHRTIKEQDLSKYQGDHNSEGSPAPKPPTCSASILGFAALRFLCFSGPSADGPPYFFGPENCPRGRPFRAQGEAH